MERRELLLTSIEDSQTSSMCLYDLKSQNILKNYKNGGIINRKSLKNLNYDYLIGAERTKPILHVWPINSQEPLKKSQIILPKPANCLEICPKNTYIAIGIETKLYIWHLTSGKLLTIQKRNYQPITCIKFTNDSNYLIITGQDGLLIVYNFSDLISINNQHTNLTIGRVDCEEIQPIYTKSDHTLAITDLFVGKFNSQSRLATVSIDQMCKLYDLITGQLLLNLIFNESLNSVIFDSNCWNLFIGMNSGRIEQFYLKNPPRQLELHSTNDDDSNFHSFVGHSKKIVCLELNLMNDLLISGSMDCFVFIWNIRLREIMKKLEFKAPITNLLCLRNHTNFFQQSTLKNVKSFIGIFDKNLMTDSVEFFDLKLQDYDIELSDCREEIEEKRTRVEGFDELVKENLQLKAANKQLYDIALEFGKKLHQPIK